MSSGKTAHLIFPHQLFEDTLDLSADLFVFVEHDLFFKQYAFHKQKLILHRASMQEFRDILVASGKRVEYIESSHISSEDQLVKILKSDVIKTITSYDMVDDWLTQRVNTVTEKLDIKRETIVSPGFLTNRGEIEEYFAKGSNRMQHFYEWQRRRLNVMMDGKKPQGGKWSFDDQNRRPLPRTIKLPNLYKHPFSGYIDPSIQWVDNKFGDNPGSTTFNYPVTHRAARDQLKQFLNERFATFGPYEDAIAKDESQLFHSVLSPLLNVGLLTPREVLDGALAHASKYNTPIASLEGFVRQLIGWREYMRATYVRFGRSMRTQNNLHFDKKLNASWWNASVGLEPIDTTIRRVLDSAYAHHIERLMVLGNSMVLLRIDPDEVYEWFMAMFIDAYDWVMVPNVYAMSQFAAGELITTKPYVSGSNYIIKMSDYKKGDWSDVWDALYWRFVDDYRAVFEQNYRSKMMVKLYDAFDSDKKQRIREISDEWI